jgi:hypothetical protein
METVSEHTRITIVKCLLLHIYICRMYNVMNHNNSPNFNLSVGKCKKKKMKTHVNE